MTRPLLFAVAYIGGTMAGIVAGFVFPWHLSGSIGWAVYLAGGLSLFERRRDFNRTLAIFRDCAPLDLRQRAIRAHVADQERGVILRMGATFGCFAGATAVSLVDVLPALQVNGHDARIDGALLASLVALIWASISAAVDDRVIDPALRGASLYLVVAALSLLPFMWGAS
jgi:uncharacterized membrane protein